MKIIYEGRDITSAVEVKRADITDNAGGQADSLEFRFADVDGLWSQWKPQKGHRVEVMEDSFSSGAMFVDQLQQGRGTFTIKALSIPLAAKTCITKAWENVRFTQFAREIAEKYGFQIETYGMQDWLYSRVDQVETTDFELLAYRCMLEGYMLKLSNQKVIVYDEQFMERQSAVRTIYEEELDGDFDFRAVSTELYNSCIVQSYSSVGSFKAECKPRTAPYGSMLKKNIHASSQGEAERFARGFLRMANKYESTGRIQIPMDTNLAAGSCISIADIGWADGKHFIDQVVHRIVEGKTLLRLRRPLEGY